MRFTPEQREIVMLLIAAAERETTEAERSRMEQLVKDDDDMQSFVLRILNQEAWLSLHGLHESTRTVPAELAAKIRELLTADETSAISQAVASQYESELLGASRACVDRGSMRRGTDAGRWRIGAMRNQTQRWIVPGACAAVLVAIGMAIGTWLNPLAALREAPGFATLSAPQGDDSFSPHGIVTANYEARLVQYTSCVWGPEMDARTSDSLRGGDSLNLVYGLADLELGWPSGGKAKVRLEGPAAVVLMGDGGVNLNHGKLTANTCLSKDRFAVETPLGRVDVLSNARIGVAVSPSSTELHVFSGNAKLVTSWASNSGESDVLEVSADQSIRLVTTETGSVQVHRGTAALDFFVAQLEMTDDLLEIPARYVSAVKDAAPVCYWRFDRPVDGLVRNEIADRYHGQVLGPAEWVEELGNGTIQFGGWLTTDLTPAHVVADRALESVDVREYSLEIWVKPSHFHLGTIVSLLSPNASAPGMHGMLLELGGPWTIFTGREHPGRVRFLHRNPPHETGGTSCFSQVAYGLRKWQHVVAVKRGPEMTLYINGQRVSHSRDATPLPDGLLLLVGQLDRGRNARLFIGQLDELAYYERALSEKEIQQHYQLVRPAKPVPTEI